MYVRDKDRLLKNRKDRFVTCCFVIFFVFVAVGLLLSVLLSDGTGWLGVNEGHD